MCDKCEILKSTESKIDSLQMAREEKLELNILNAFENIQKGILSDYENGKAIKIDPDIIADPIKLAMMESYHLGKAMGEYTLKNITDSKKHSHLNLLKNTNDEDIILPEEYKFSLYDGSQNFDYDCGPTAGQDVGVYYGENWSLDWITKQMGTTKENGTDPSQIKSFFEKNGYTVDLQEMTIDDVKKYIFHNIPVILDVQAWHTDQPEGYDYSKADEDGHYIALCGYTKTGFLFDDPSSIGLSVFRLSPGAKDGYEELIRRWHDTDVNGNRLNNIGIAVYGKPPVYDPNKIVEMG